MATSGTGEIRVNRATQPAPRAVSPGDRCAMVLTLWAAVVAERLGHDPDAAITLGRAVAGSSTRIKARAIGLEEGKREEDARETAASRAERRAPPTRTVHLLGRDVSVVEGKGGLRALDHDRDPASPAPARAYVERALGEHLPAVRRVMERLAAPLDPEELNRVGFRFYERFRPEVPAGALQPAPRAVPYVDGRETQVHPHGSSAAVRLRLEA